MEHSPHPDRQKQLAVLLKKNNKFCVQVSQTYNQFWQEVLNSALHKKERARNLCDERKNIKLLENMHRRHGSKPSLHKDAPQTQRLHVNTRGTARLGVRGPRCWRLRLRIFAKPLYLALLFSARRKVGELQAKAA